MGAMGTATRSRGTTLVAGIDSSTQSCKVVIRDAATGTLVRQGRAGHPDGTEVDPQVWWRALQEALAAAGGLEDVAAIAVGGQQHGMVALDDAGRVVRPAMLWNDTRSAPAALELTRELGAQVWAELTGLVPLASYTATKLRWLAEHEPGNAARVAAVALPHDWITWRLRGFGPPGEAPLGGDLSALVTDRSDASGTAYFDPVRGRYDTGLLVRCLGHEATLPRVAAPSEVVGTVHGAGAVVGPGAGDNAAAALGLGLEEGDAAVSLGTSGVVSAVSNTPSHDATGLVSGFADATGRFLPLACTLNAARVLDAVARWLGVDHDELSALALATPPGADGLVLVPYLEGERTPNLPDATGALHGITLSTATRGHLARAAIEGMLCGQADGLDALRRVGHHPRRLYLIGGAARSPAVQHIAASIFGLDVVVPEPGEYVADGAARQAAWVLDGGIEPPRWEPATPAAARPAGPPEVSETIRSRYAQARTHFVRR